MMMMWFFFMVMFVFVGLLSVLLLEEGYVWLLKKFVFCCGDVVLGKFWWIFVFVVFGFCLLIKWT